MSAIEMPPPAKPSKPAIVPTRADNFPEWFQTVIKEADLAESAVVRGCMVLKPDGYAIWESIQGQFDPMLKSKGVRNAAFPLLIPLEYFQREAKHAQGFATEVAVVTHRRLEADENGVLHPAAELEQPLIVRPTSEMIIGESMARWIQSHRDLPLKLNQWCSVMRMEMRPRIFLRTAEFWWHEGHSAHASAEDAERHTLEMFELYERFVVDNLAIPVIAGEKIPSERFAGAERTFSLEAMMQDGKALQAATSHYLGQNFSKAMEIVFQNAAGEREFAYTTSWGMSTRIVGALIMVHSDDDGLRLPPRIAPTQAIILPVIPKEELSGTVMEYAERVKKALEGVSFYGRPLSVAIDGRDMRGGHKAWEAIKKGVPLRIEVGPKECEGSQVVVMRRDLPTGSKTVIPLDELVQRMSATLEEQQRHLFRQAEHVLSSKMRTDITTLAQLREYYSTQEDSAAKPGFVRAKWCEDPASLELLSDMKLTVRCIPRGASTEKGVCLLTGKPATLEVIFARAY